MSNSSDFAVVMQHITKSFGEVVANQDVSLQIKRHSIHGIIGENGAGKTTLMRLLYGMYRPDSGNIQVWGENVHFSSPKDAIACRIGMVHQHFTLVPSMSVIENILLGRPPLKHGFIDRKRSEELVKELCDFYQFDMDIHALVQDIPVGLKQRVEILKALYLGADILIMDEPTAVLTPQEITGLFETLRSLRDKGASIILITHKLSEVMRLTDEVTVMRDGCVTGHVKTSETNERELAQMMVGRGVFLQTGERKNITDTEELLRITDLAYRNEEGVLILDGLSLQLKGGTILGIAGVQGNGQTELAEIIAGMRHQYQGEIFLCGNKTAPKDSPWRRRELGLGHIPEDRQIHGSASIASIEDNYLMTNYRTPAFSSHGFLSRKIGLEHLEQARKAFAIKMPGPKAAGGTLSGGNMQKLIVAREYGLNPQVLIAAQPTRGVDIGATEFIHQKLLEMRDNGKAILLISNELTEIMSLSDRILVIYKGRFVGEVLASDANEEQLGLWMAGITGQVS